ncbi:hypothetical protein [Parapedobacter sp. 10938]|nr:hypothetical protein [Parapedobacter sp. 10938]MEC3881789.1 hypothetical protein [Parapedobacter sp. 10938]
MKHKVGCKWKLRDRKAGKPVIFRTTLDLVQMAMGSGGSKRCRTLCF